MQESKTDHQRGIEPFENYQAKKMPLKPAPTKVKAKKTSSKKKRK